MRAAVQGAVRPKKSDDGGEKDVRKQREERSTRKTGRQGRRCILSGSSGLFRQRKDADAEGNTRGRMHCMEDWERLKQSITKTERHENIGFESGRPALSAIFAEGSNGESGIRVLRNGGHRRGRGDGATVGGGSRTSSASANTT